MRNPQYLVGGVLDGVCDTVGAMSLQSPLRVLSATLLASCLSPVTQLMTQSSVWSKREMRLLGNNRHSWVSLRNYRSIHFVLSTLSNASKLFFFFLVPLLCWNFSTENLDFHKGSLIHGWLSETVFSRGSTHSQEGLEPVHRPLQSPQTGPRSVCLLSSPQ